ncbi:MAG: FeoA family protein [Anaerolineales bacterium]
MTRALRLDQIRAGEIVRLRGFVRCRRSGLRLTELGLTPGTSVEVIQSSRGQPVLLRVRGAQLAIDRITAHKIEVEATSAVFEDRKIGRHYRRRGMGGRRRIGWRWRRQNRDVSQNTQDHDRNSEGDSSER